MVPGLPAVHRTRVWFGILGVVILVALGLAGYWWFRSHGDASTVPAELKTALFISDSADGVVYASGKNGLVALTAVGEVVHTALRDQKHLGYVLSNAQGSYSILLDGTAVITSSRPIRTLAFSPDDTKIAFAEQVSGAASSTAASDWHAMVYALDTKKITDVGTGFSPYFLGDAHLIYFTPTGVHFRDLTNGYDSIIQPASFSQVDIQTSQSPDRKAFAWVTPSGFAATYRVTHVSPPKIEAYRAGAVAATSAVTLGTRAFYEVRQNNGVSEVWKSVPTSTRPTLIYRAPPGIAISRIVL